MKFSIAVNYGRFQKTMPMQQVMSEALDLVRIADEGGFDIAWTAEHHTIEFTASPNPFQILTHWAQHTRSIRLGTAVIAAPYWNPIRLAGEAALCDILTGGRLELGLGRGSYQYEFDRMGGGMPQQEGGRYMRELIPAVKELWKGDYEHKGEIWSFPSTTCAPKPIQKSIPLWVAARDENSFKFAVANGCSVMSTALRRPFEEVEALEGRFRAVTKDHPGRKLEHATLRLGCVYNNPAVGDVVVRAVIDYGRNFENLFKNIASVKDGFPEPVSIEALANRDEFLPQNIKANLMIGTPDEVIEKLERYRAAGIHHFILGTSFGLPHDVARRSIELFCEQVIPHFRTGAAMTPLQAAV